MPFVPVRLFLFFFEREREPEADKRFMSALERLLSAGLCNAEKTRLRAH